MRNRFIILSALFFCLIILLSCASQREIRESPDKKGNPALSLKMGELNKAYALGSPIEFEMFLTVDSEEAVEAVFPSSCPAEFVVYRDIEPIWNSLEGAACLQIINTIEFEPGDTVRYNTLWNCTTSSWKGVMLGKYSVQGVLLSNPPIKTKAVSFYLVD